MLNILNLSLNTNILICDVLLTLDLVYIPKFMNHEVITDVIG